MKDLFKETTKEIKYFKPCLSSMKHVTDKIKKKKTKI